MISVRNFKRYQHYRNRRPPWVKLYRDLLTDYDFAALPDEVKWQAVGLLLLASETRNSIPFDEKWIARRLSLKNPLDIEILVNAGWARISGDHASKALAFRKQNVPRLREVEVEIEVEVEKDPLRVPEALAPLTELLGRAREACASTRVKGRMADSVWAAFLSKAAQAPPEAVEAGVEIFLDREYHLEGKDERYLLGVIRGKTKRQAHERAPETKRRIKTSPSGLPLRREDWEEWEKQK
ncbi:MAG: hypothetical protein ACE5HV_11835 [Acidobacteriota bacterium]